jgi:hypothetical protein
MKQNGFIIFGSSLLIFLCSLIGYVIAKGTIANFGSALCQFDCGWYQSIMQSGYVFDLGRQSNVAFFPLFPFVWKTFNFSHSWMTIINATIFMVALLYVCQQLVIPIKSTLIFCFAGMVTFLLVPYSESFFFAASVLMLVGFYKKQNVFLFIGICLAIFTRSASMIFIVAFSFMILLAFINKERKLIGGFVIAIFLSVLCTAIVFAIHSYYTGVWNGFFITQSYWDFELQIPHIPFIQGAWPITLFDSSALLIGLVSSVLLVLYAIECLYKTQNKYVLFNEKLRPHELFSLLYLAGCTFVVILFLGGTLRSLGRFVFSTPFYLIFITLFITERIRIYWNWKLLSGVGLALLLLLPKGQYPEHVLLLMINSVALGWLIFYTPKHLTKTYKLLLVCVLIWGVIQQSIALFGYFNGNWMG